MDTIGGYIVDSFVVTFTHMKDDGKTMEEQHVCENMVSVARLFMVTKPKRGYTIVSVLVTPHVSLFDSFDEI